jgi:gamma-glutamylputrescine oxidase
MSALPNQGVYWQLATVDDPPDVLREDAVADTAIVGGGLAGLSCADRLCDAGQSVIILERGRCGSGASGRSSGFLTPDSELELTDLIRNRGEECAKALWELAGSGSRRFTTRCGDS